MLQETRPPPSAIEERTLTLEHADGRLTATYLPAGGPPPPGPRLAALLFRHPEADRLHGHLARTLAAAGHAVLLLDAPATTDAPVVPAVFTALREQAAPERVVVCGALAAAAAVAAAAVAGGADGLVLAGSRLPPEGLAEDLRVFDQLGAFDGALLLLGVGDVTEERAPDDLLAADAQAWESASPTRSLEIGLFDGPRTMLPLGADHILAPGAYAGLVGDFTVQWLERQFGLGYPRAWQGEPPSQTLPSGPERDDSPAAQVPLLTTGALLHPPDAFGDAEQPGWRMELPDGRAFALTDALRRLVALVDGHRTVGEIATSLSEEMGRPVSAAQISTLLHDRLAPLGVLEPDARGEGGEDESGMTDILIRCYEPHDRLRALLDNLTRVTRSPYNVILCVGKRSAVLNQNVGLDRALTRYAVFLDDDVILTEGWLERLRETMDRTGAGIVYARQLRMDGSLLSTSAASPHGEIVEALSGGACFMFRNDLGLRFDEYYVKSQWDDIDFAFEFYARGYKSYMDGRADFYHHNDPKVWRAQNLCHFVDKWMRKGLFRGWTMYKYEAGTAIWPCFGPDVWAPQGSDDPC
jgi:hypothetical protein